MASPSRPFAQKVSLACDSRFGSENLTGVYSMIRKSGNRFSEKIMLK